MELHPCFPQPEFFKFVMDNGIVPIGFAPIGSPTRPDRDKTPGDAVDIEDPAIQAIAKRLGLHPATVCVKWAVQRGQVPIPMSIYRNEYLSNLRSTVSAPLTDEEMAAIARALVINIGTLSAPWIAAMFKAGEAARRNARPEQPGRSGRPHAPGPRAAGQYRRAPPW